MEKKEQTRLRVQRYRERQQSVTETPENVTQGVTLSPADKDFEFEDVTRPYFRDGKEMVPPWGILPERSRYLTLSDGQILDRAKPIPPAGNDKVKEAS